MINGRGTIKSDDGAAVVEFILVAALVALVAITAVTRFGRQLACMTATNQLYFSQTPIEGSPGFCQFQFGPYDSIGHCDLEQVNYSNWIASCTGRSARFRMLYPDF